MKTDAPKEPLPASFPLSKAVAALKTWWEAEKSDASLPGDVKTTPDIMRPSVEIDSHRAVRALLVLEEIVKIDIPDSTIKDGGYNNIEEMEAHLIPCIQALYEKERKKQDA